MELLLEKFLKRFASNERGAIILILGLLLPLLVAMVGLSVDVGNWYYAERRVQTAADAAAMSGGLTLFHTKDPYDAEAAAIDSAGRNDYVAGSGRVLTVNTPPTSGEYSGGSSAVEVIAVEEQPLYFASILYKDPVYVRSRAVAAAVDMPGEHCILGLDEEREATVGFSGTARVNMGCGIASNSVHNAGLELWGGAQVDAEPMTAVGDIAVGGSSVLTPADQLLRPWQSPAIDPFGPEGRDLQVPTSPSSCTYNNLHIDATTETLAEGRYCGGLFITDSTVTFLAGVHIIDGGGFTVAGTSTLLGDGVTFVMTGSGTKYATVHFGGGTTADLTAPTFGELEGVVFFSDPDAPSFKGSQLVTSEFIGGSSMNITGAIYDPAREIVFTGGGSLSGSCLLIIGRKVSLNGESNIDNDCPANMDLPEIVSRQVKIVE